MRMTLSRAAPARRGTENRPPVSAMERDRNLPAASANDTTAPRIGSLVPLSRTVPSTRWAAAGATSAADATSASTTHRATRAAGLRAPARESVNSFDETIDFILARVTTASDAHESLRRQPETVDDRGGVKVPIGDKHSALGERNGHVVRRVAAEREGQRRRPRIAGGRPVQRQ